MKYEELEEISRNWESTNLLSIFEDKLGVATCLQAQVITNEGSDCHPSFKRISVPLVVRFLSESKCAKRNHFCNYFDGEEPLQMIFKAKYTPFEYVDGDPINLDNEAAAVAQLASDIAKEIDESFSDVMNRDIVFHGFRCLDNGTIIMSYS